MCIQLEILLLSYKSSILNAYEKKKREAEKEAEEEDKEEKNDIDYTPLMEYFLPSRIHYLNSLLGEEYKDN